MALSSPSKLILLLALQMTAVALPSTDTIRQKIQDAALRAYIDPRLVEAVVTAESNFDTKAKSRAGAMGLMQVMPETAKQSGIRAPYHSVDNLMGACQYLRKMLNRYSGNVSFALAAYNAGPANVDRYKGIPPFKETRLYVKRVLKLYAKLKKS